MRREIFSEEHEIFREQIKRFIEAEVEPRIEGWNRDGISDRESWKRCGDEGYLGHLFSGLRPRG